MVNGRRNFRNLAWIFHWWYPSERIVSSTCSNSLPALLPDPIAHDRGIEVVPGPDWRKLFRWLLSQRASFLPYHTMYLVTDNRDLQADEVQTTPGLAHWPKVAAWWQERIRYVGPYGELTTVVFVHISEDTGLDRVHPTWAGTYVLDACVFLFHKRARSVDTGRDTQQPGPPSKLSRSLSADNLDEAAQPSPAADDFAAEVDYGSSPERCPPKKSTRTPTGAFSKKAIAPDSPCRWSIVSGLRPKRICTCLSNMVLRSHTSQVGKPTWAVHSTTIHIGPR